MHLTFRSVVCRTSYILLIGVSYPVNSVGIIPHEILNTTLENKAKGIYTNMKQIMLQYYAHESKVKRNSLIFKEYQYVDRGRLFIL